MCKEFQRTLPFCICLCDLLHHKSCVMYVCIPFLFIFCIRQLSFCYERYKLTSVSLFYLYLVERINTDQYRIQIFFSGTLGWGASQSSRRDIQRNYAFLYICIIYKHKMPNLHSVSYVPPEPPLNSSPTPIKWENLSSLLKNSNCYFSILFRHGQNN